MNLDGLVAELKQSRLPPPVRRRKIRQQAGLSATRAAAVLGVATSTLISWEEGATPQREHKLRYRQFLDALGGLA